MNKVVRSVLLFALLALTVSTGLPSTPAQSADMQYSVWLIESSRFMGVPAGAFMPDRAFVPGSSNKMNNKPFFDLPVNVGVIKGGRDVVLYDTGWKQQDYHKMTGTQHWAPIAQQLAQLGIKLEDVTKLVIGHGHWAAGVWERRVLVLGGDPRLDDREPAADRYGPAVPRV